MPPDFRARQEAVASRYVSAFESDFEVVYPGLVASSADGRRANDVFRSGEVDAVVFAPVMAAPPSYAAKALEGLDVPLVIWNAPIVNRLGADLDQASAHEHTTTISAIMLANVLVRRGVPTVTITASPDDPRGTERVRAAIRTAVSEPALAGRLLLRLGDPIAGYLDVEATNDQLAMLGLNEHRVTSKELTDALADVTTDQIEAIRTEIGARGWHGAPDTRSVRVAAALLALIETYGAFAGTINCHGPLFRDSEDVGICACLAASLATARGVPFSCTGDQPTAIALVLGRALAGAALYGEFYAPELASGLVLFANGGEGDDLWAGGPVTIRPSQHYPGLNGRGASLSFPLHSGPCTLLSVTPTEAGWRGVWACAEVVETRYPQLGAPNAMLRFPGVDISDALDAWATAGATHHHALLRGDLSSSLPQALAAAGIAPIHAL
jgi:L-arabinose isomerase